MTPEQTEVQERVREAFPGSSVHVTPSSRHRARRYVDVTVLLPSEDPAYAYRHASVTIGDSPGALPWEVSIEQIVAALRAATWKPFS